MIYDNFYYYTYPFQERSNTAKSKKLDLQAQLH